MVFLAFWALCVLPVAVGVYVWAWARPARATEDQVTRDELKITAVWLGLVGCCMVVWACVATLLAWWVF